MRYLGIDFGTKRTGVAISDSDGRFAIVKETIHAEIQQEVIDRLKEIIDEEKVETIVVGLPVNMENQPTEMTERVERFVENLRNHVLIPVQTTDERLTSEMAEKLLRGVDQSKRDQVAAQILLQNFLDQRAQSGTV